MLDVDSSIHLKQVDLDYAASFNKNEISGTSDTYIVILIMSEYCRRGQHFNGRDNFVDECVNSCERNSRANLQWNFTGGLRFCIRMAVEVWRNSRKESNRSLMRTFSQRQLVARTSTLIAFKRDTQPIRTP